MAIEKALDNILDMPSKVKILRLFASKREDFIAGGREIARLAGISPPAAHAALKDLYGIGVLKRTIAGRQHLYSLNTGNRNVKTINWGIHFTDVATSCCSFSVFGLSYV
jgi:predicted DNA-binding transcriptional regulator